PMSPTVRRTVIALSTDHMAETTANAIISTMGQWEKTARTDRRQYVINTPPTPQYRSRKAVREKGSVLDSESCWPARSSGNDVVAPVSRTTPMTASTAIMYFRSASAEAGPWDIRLVAIAPEALSEFLRHQAAE